jgi:hypothetical protein
MYGKAGIHFFTQVRTASIACVQHHPAARVLSRDAGTV